VLVIGSFLFIATQIRLGFLAEMMMLSAVLYLPPGILGQPIGPMLGHVKPLPHWVSTLVGMGLWGYLVLLPITRAGLFTNFYIRRRLWPWLQAALDAYTNVTGIMIWRVFSADHTCFYCRVWRTEPGAEGDRELLSDFAKIGSRFNHVGEAIVLTSIFTSLKYYPANPGLFEERLLRYARTLPSSGEQHLIFEYVAIRKDADRFRFVPVMEFQVNVQMGQVSQRPMADEVDCLRAARRWSQLRPASRPGTYVA
jgi:hypothetical protein